MASATYELKSPARCIVAHADEAHHGFLVSTANLRGPNEIRLLRYSEEEDNIRCAAIWHHTHEVLSLSASAADGTLVSTVFSSTLDGRGGRGALWRLPDVPAGEEASEGYDASGPPLEPVPKELVSLGELPPAPLGASAASAQAGSGGVDPLHHLQWAPQADGHDATGTLVSAHSGSVRCWRLREGGGAATEIGFARLDSEASFVGGVAWDPHHAAEAAVAADGTVTCWDVRSGDRTRAIEHAVSVAGGVVRGLSYNPNKPWHLASAGDDFRVKIWDLRRVTAPVKVLEGHSHWATAVAFNPFHDQLLLSGGADCRTDLWRVGSVSSAPLLELGEDDGAGEGAGGGDEGSGGRRAEPRLASDQAIRVHVDHEDSVTGVAWSLAGAWVYGSLSYTGRVAVAQVPPAEKYRVLL